MIKINEGLWKGIGKKLNLDDKYIDKFDPSRKYIKIIDNIKYKDNDG
jgi:hypothetical protein